MGAAGLLEIPTESLKVFRIPPGRQSLINTPPLGNQGRATFGAILGCAKQVFGFAMALTSFLRSSSYVLVVTSSIPGGISVTGLTAKG